MCSRIIEEGDAWTTAGIFSGGNKNSLGANLKFMAPGITKVLKEK